MDGVWAEGEVRIRCVPCSKPNQDISSIRNDLEDDELIGLRIGCEIVVCRQHDGPVAVRQRLSPGDGLNVVEPHTLVCLLYTSPSPRDS